MEGRRIPIPVIAVVADVLATRYTHSRIDYFMEVAGVKGPPPLGNKVDKARAWLRRANEQNAAPLAALGRAIAELMETGTAGYASQTSLDPERARVEEILADNGLAYLKGGDVVPVGTTAVTRSLQEIIAARDLAGIQTECDRILENLERDPAAAVTASCALLESLFRYYIEDKGLELPAEQSIRPLWKLVRQDMKLDPAAVDDDLKLILIGLGSIVEGMGSLRTHRGSAHGRGKRTYKVSARHARLAAHAAFTLALFVLETWGQGRPRSPGA